MLKSASQKSKSKILLLVLASLIALGVIYLLTYPNISQNQINPAETEAIFADKTYAAFENIAKNKGVDVAYDILKQKFSRNEAEAHDFAHVVGLVAYDQKGINGLNICDNAYNYGCYHGFIEGFISQKSVEKVSDIEKSCLNLGSVHAPSCLHGIGHGVMATRSYNLKDALLDCNLLEQQSQTYCWDGVFMENVTGSMLKPESKTKITDKNLNEPCDSLDYHLKNSCFRNQVSLWFDFYHNDQQKVGKQCQKIPKEYQDTCFENIGYINVMNGQEDLQRLITLCVIDQKANDFCLIGEMKELLFEGKSSEIAQSLCGYVSPAKSGECQSQFKQHYNQYRLRYGRT